MTEPRLNPKISSRGSMFLDRIRRKIGWALLTTKPFRVFLWLGVQLTPVHFYSPVPDVRDLKRRPEIWQSPFDLAGVAMRGEFQRSVMTEVFAKYQDECNFPARETEDRYQYHTSNVYFGYASAAAMHSFIRHERPRRIVEAGAGYSTLVIAEAARRNTREGNLTEIVAIDPYPSNTVRSGIPGVTSLLTDPIQDVALSTFDDLERGDILSIDTSHTVKIGGEVPYIYLRLLPRLQPGVLVHIHDIHLPDEYPRDLVLKRYFWNEQYLVHAFLIGNDLFDVVWAQRYSELTFPDDYRETFCGRTDEAENHRSYSLWLRRTDRKPT